jgi:type I restriction-modification system DNA methylase subunit
MISNIQTKIKKREKANDIFYTPIDLVKIHLNLVKEYVSKDDIILDPFFGTGNYYNTYPEIFKNSNTFEYTEIELKKDFFEYNKDVNIIISNPPYSIIDKVLEKSVSLNPHTISYLIGHNNFTCKRIEYMNNKGYYLDKMYFTKVHQWFGMSLIVVFTKKSKKNCVEFDRKIWH